MGCKSGQKKDGRNYWFWELIDTLWNVNAEATAEPAETENWINRYIMECKSRQEKDGRNDWFWELIDTLWNVNVAL